MTDEAPLGSASVPYFEGMTGAGRFLLGSVPNKISHHAPCALLIVRTT